MNYKTWWDFFNEDLYQKYKRAFRAVHKHEYLYTYKITYKYYKGTTDAAKMCTATKYVKANDRGEAMRLFGMWEKLILKIEKV